MEQCQVLNVRQVIVRTFVHITLRPYLENHSFVFQYKGLLYITDMCHVVNITYLPLLNVT